MKTRILPVEDWARVPEMPLPEVRDAATNGVVIAVEDDDGQIVGSCTVFLCVHMEGAWIDPARRSKTAVARRLITAVRNVVASMGAQGALTCVPPDSVMRGIWDSRGAVHVQGEHFMVRMQ